MNHWSKAYQITPDGLPNEGILFADNEKNNRSGHMGHALVEYAPGKILAFYPNCSVDGRFKGHSGDGWMEYKRSEDGGDTWSDPIVLDYTKQLLEESDHTRSIMCEKAVVADDGKIVLFNLHCDLVTDDEIWEPYFEPTYSISRDGGNTWETRRPFCKERGRIYDAVVRNGVIYVLMFANPELPGIAHSEEHDYQIYVSYDNGENFQLLCNVPFASTINCYYGTMEFLKDGSMIVYIYDERDEHNPKYIVSPDGCKSWEIPRRAFFAKKIRNPQIIRFGDTYFMHGRSGSIGAGTGHFVLYVSDDGIHWDEGTYLRMVEAGAGAYSNNLLVGGRFGSDHQRVMIQTSHAYKANQTNTIMWWLTKK